MDKQQLKALVADDEIQSALDALLKITPQLGNNIHNEAIHLNSRFRGYQKDLNSGMVGRDELQITLNQIRNSLNFLIDRLPGGDLGNLPPDAKPSPPATQPAANGNGGVPAPTPSPSPGEPGKKSIALGAASLVAVVGLFVGMVMLQGKMGNAEVLGEMLFIVLLGILAGIAYFQLMPESHAEGDGKYLGMNVKFRGPIMAGILVAVGSYFFIQSRGNNDPFSYTVSLQQDKSLNLSQNYPKLENVALKLWHLNEWRYADVSEDGVADFKNIDPSLKGQKVAVDFQTRKYWKLAADSIELNGGSTTLQVVPDGSLGKITGKVRSLADGNPLPGALVEVDGLTAKADDLGNFTIDIPLEKQKENYTLIASLTGYQSKEQFHNPASGPADLRLSK